MSTECLEDVFAQRLLHTNRRRFRATAVSLGSNTAEPADTAATGLVVAPWLAVSGHADYAWLARTAASPCHRPPPTRWAPSTTRRHWRLLLCATGPANRPTRDAHYSAELRRLMRWCGTHGLGPLSDLTRQQLLAYLHALQHGECRTESASPPLSEATRTRALAVVASLYRYWYATGYLHANPAAGLSAGGRARSGFVPTRLIPPALLDACDAWLDASISEVIDGMGIALESIRLAERELATA